MKILMDYVLYCVQALDATTNKGWNMTHFTCNVRYIDVRYNVRYIDARCNVRYIAHMLSREMYLYMIVAYLRAPLYMIVYYFMFSFWFLLISSFSYILLCFCFNCSVTMLFFPCILMSFSIYFSLILISAYKRMFVWFLTCCLINVSLLFIKLRKRNLS